MSEYAQPLPSELVRLHVANRILRRYARRYKKQPDDFSNALREIAAKACRVYSVRKWGQYRQLEPPDPDYWETKSADRTMLDSVMQDGSLATISRVDMKRAAGIVPPIADTSAPDPAHFTSSSPNPRPRGRKRGRTPQAVGQAIEAINADLASGAITRQSLDSQPLKILKDKYKTGLNTIRSARNFVLSSPI
jgi:hypothetical protein